MSRTDEAKQIEREEELKMAEKEFVDGVGYRFKDSNKEHLHVFNGRPLIGTSTVSSVLAKPLTWWASGLACEKLGWMNKGNAKKGWTPKEERLKKAGAMLEELRYMSEEQYLDLLDDAYKAHSVKLETSAEAGTDLHAELERFVKYHMGLIVAAKDFDPKIKPFIEWTEQNVKRFISSEGHVFSTRMWTGGITDCVCELNDGRFGIIDFKSSKEAYISQFLQIAGYDIQITENGIFSPEGVQTWKAERPFDFYAVVPFGAPKFTVEFRNDTEVLKEGFEAMLKLYKIINN